jgi:hypothetical protein
MTNDIEALELFLAVKAIQQKLKSREFLDPEVTVSVSTSDWRTTRLDLSYKVRSDSVTTYKSFYGESAAEITELFSEGHVHIVGLKSKAELEHEEFMLMLGRVMDRAKELGMDEHFINPLTAMMTELASNAIEHKR